MKNLQDELRRWMHANGHGRGECLIIAEVAQAHDGSLGMAHAFIDAIGRAGADAVKFQTHLACAESTPEEPWRVPFSRQDRNRHAYWKRMEFTEEQWTGLKKHATEAGLMFLSSPFSVEAVDLLTRVGVAGWKVASGEVAGGEMFERMAATGWPMLISTGMSDWREIDGIVERLKARGIPGALLQCTTAYPCPPERVGLNIVSEIRKRYGLPGGLSDHSGTIFPGLAAATIGAAVVEVHVTLSREMFGPDVASSVTTGELAQMVQGIRFIERAMAHPVDKDAVAVEMTATRAIFGKSIVARSALKAGTVLRREHLALKKPGTGIPERRFDEVLNRRLKRDVSEDSLIREEELE